MGHVVEITIIIALASCLMGLAVWSVRKARASREAELRTTLAFERTLTGSGLAPALPPAASDQAGFDPPAEAPLESSPSARAPAIDLGASGAGPSETPSAAIESGTLTESIVGKLTAANLIEGVDGPIAREAQGPQGTSLRLRGGQRIAILESGFDPADPETEKLLRRFDGVVIAGAGDEPFYVHRFQKFLADRIAF